MNVEENERGADGKEKENKPLVFQTYWMTSSSYLCMYKVYAITSK